MAFCSKCGTKVLAQADFCSSCGANLKDFSPEDTFKSNRVSIPSFKIPTIKWKPIGIIGAILLGLIGAFFVGNKLFETMSSEASVATPSALTLEMAPEFDKFNGQVAHFSDGLASVKVGDRYGYVDESGEMVIEPTLSFAWPFKDGLAKVVVGDTVSGENAIDVWNDIERGVALKFRFIDKTGIRLGNIDYDSASEFSEGLADVCIDRKCGFIDPQGEIAIPLQYDASAPFSGGMAYTHQNPNSDLLPDIKFIDHSGNTIFEIKKHLGGSRFSDDLLQVNPSQTETKYVDKKGNVVIDLQSAPRTYQERVFKLRGFNSFSSGLVAVDAVDRSGEGGCGYLDTSGEIVIEPQFENCGEFRGKYAAVLKRSDDIRTGHIIDKAGNNVLDREYEYIASEFSYSTDYSGEDYWSIRHDDKKGAFSKDGKLIEPVYDEIKSMSHGLYAIKLNGKWGVVNTAGEILIEPQFNSVGRYSEGRAFVIVDGKAGFLVG